MGRIAVVNENYWRVVQAARRDLHRSLTQNNNNAAPILLRLAFHDAANYDATTKQGGANGSVRFTQELNRPANNGIQNAVRFCEPIKRRYPDITYADLYQLAGIVAVEVTGGPAIDFIPGRTDTDVPDDDGIPNPNGGADHLRNVFYRMGLNDKDIVALSGAHALGGAHRDRSGFDGNFTRNPLKFDNSYFVEVLRGDTPGLVKLPTDKVLVTDPRFRPFVELYARDQGAFFRDYAESHKKMAELGFNNYNHHQGSNNVYENGGCTEQQDLDCAQAYVFGDYNGGCPGQYGYAAKPYANNNGNGCCPVSGYYYNAC